MSWLYCFGKAHNLKGNMTPEVLRMRKRARFINGIKDIIDYIDIDNIIMVEVGCYTGESTKLFADCHKVKTIYCVDQWVEGYDDLDGASSSNMVLVEQEFDKRINNIDKCIKIKSNSVGAAAKFETESLDFVYIDAMHTYDGVKSDILAWKPKIKKGGYIGGHDYPNPSRPRRPRRGGRFGVGQAVDEFFGKPERIFQDSSWIVKLTDKELL